MRQIAEHTGINEAPIYRHFASKQDLLAAAVLDPLHRVTRELEATAQALPEGSDQT